jgi:uncharacterized protein (TIGR00725 family)
LTRQKRLVGVIGAGVVTADGEQQAYRVGRLIAEQAAVLVCGGLGGVMEAAAKGCVEAGGDVIGVLPGDSATAANPYVTLPIVTNMGHARNIIIAHTADVLIAVEGEYGTVSEMAIGLKLGKTVIQLNSRHKMDKAIVASTPEEAVNLAFMAIAGGDRIS